MNTQNLSPETEALIARNAHLLPYIFQEWQKKVDILKTLDIVILAELDDEGKELSKILKQKGFEKVDWQVVKVNKREKIEAELIIFHRSTSAPIIKNLPNDLINRYTKEFKREQKFLYYGPNNRELDTRMRHMTFANYEAKLKGNILGLFES